MNPNTLKAAHLLLDNLDATKTGVATDIRALQALRRDAQRLIRQVRAEIRHAQQPSVCRRLAEWIGTFNFRSNH